MAMKYKQQVFFSLLAITLFSLTGCDKFFDFTKSLGKTTCADIKDQIIEISKGTDEIIELTDIIEQKDQKPTNVNLPGNVYISCSANAFTKSGSKIPIFMYKSKSGDSDYYGYEDATSINALKMLKNLLNPSDNNQNAPAQEAVAPAEAAPAPAEAAEAPAAAK
jgi:hypothetical protein